MKGLNNFGYFIIGAILAVLLVSMMSTGSLQGLLGVTTTTETPNIQQTIYVQQPATTQQTVVTQSREQIPVDTLYANAKDKFTMAAVDGDILFYTPGADVSDPNIKPLDTIDITNGVGSTSNKIIQTNTDYDVWFNGSSSYYDELIADWKININPETGSGSLIIGAKTYYEAVPVGSFVDLDSLPEYESGWNESGTDTIYYDKSNFGGSAWLKMDIGNSKANSELHDVVMCFLDSDADLEGDEITDITASYVSGSQEISIPATIGAYWNDAAGTGSAVCFKIADKLGSAEKARWQFTFTVNEANWDPGEEFQICFDDLGDYKAKQYPSRHAKASAECLTIDVQA